MDNPSLWHRGKKDKVTYSLISPTFKRADEVAEFLDSLQDQDFPDFEVILADGTPEQSLEQVAEAHRGKLDLHFLYQSGLPVSDARNAAAKVARGTFFIFLDSDCLIPPDYLNKIEAHLSRQNLDLFGGPDAAHPNFSPVQKAISYTMTSLFTTGGIRGKKQGMGTFHPRGFNMGIRADWFRKVEGYNTQLVCGEDVDLSIRLIAAGATSALIPEAFVYHKRRTDFRKFFKQVYRFGAARIHLFRQHPGELKITHLFPAVFLLTHPIILLMWFIYWPLGLLASLGLALYALALFLDAWRSEKSLWVALLSVRAAWTQLFGYGWGFLRNLWATYVLRKKEGLRL